LSLVDKEIPLEIEMGGNAKEGFAEMNKDGKLKEGVGMQVRKLEMIIMEDAMKK